jgi:hypothetical protein
VEGKGQTRPVIQCPSGSGGALFVVTGYLDVRFAGFHYDGSTAKQFVSVSGSSSLLTLSDFVILANPVTNPRTTASVEFAIIDNGAEVIFVNVCYIRISYTSFIYLFI